MAWSGVLGSYAERVTLPAERAVAVPEGMGAISPDGKRFLMIKLPQTVQPAGEAPRKINIILNWTEELKQILAAGGVR